MSQPSGEDLEKDWRLKLARSLIMSLRVEKFRMPAKPCVIGVWHEEIAAAIAAFYPYPGVGLSSMSRDGRITAALYQSLGSRAVYASSSRSTLSERRKLYKAVSEDYVYVTLDGPRGPRRVAKPGLLSVAAFCGVPLYPIRCIHSGLRAKSWDRNHVPWPFAKVKVVIGNALHPKRNRIVSATARLEQVMAELAGERPSDRP